jgi:hypothetical protein
MLASSKGVQITSAEDLTRSVKDMHVNCAFPGDDQEASSKSGNGEQSENKLDTTVGRFHARKFESKEGRSPGRKNVLSVQGTGTGKKQKTPIKVNMQGALQSMKEEQEVKIEMIPTNQQDLMEEGMNSGASSPKLDTRNLMGTQDESRQEK